MLILTYVSMTYLLSHLQYHVSHDGLYKLEVRSALEDKSLCDLIWWMLLSFV